jgi:hypothetical protein
MIFMFLLGNIQNIPAVVKTAVGAYPVGLLFLVAVRALYKV